MSERQRATIGSGARWPASGAHSVAERFDAAAATYGEATSIQRQVADALAAATLDVGVSEDGRVAEFGCGIGYLTQALLPRIEPSYWLASDIAPAMLTRLDRRLQHPVLSTARIDAVEPGLEPGFDLVCSSLALQWLPDPAQVVSGWRRLVRPGGLLALSTLVEGSFSEWRDALSQAGAPTPTPAFATLKNLSGWFGPQAIIEPLPLVERHASGLAFLRAARLAGIDAGGPRPLEPGVMRRAIKAFEAKGCAITYRAVLVVERA